MWCGLIIVCVYLFFNGSGFKAAIFTTPASTVDASTQLGAKSAATGVSAPATGPAAHNPNNPHKTSTPATIKLPKNQLA
jgi:hypothetical protein